jgi:hypothetical protein
MKYTININQCALFTAGLLGKVDLTDIAILEYLKDFVFYTKHKSIYLNILPRSSQATNKNNKFGQSNAIAKYHSCGNIAQAGRGKEYIWLNYKHLMDSLPFANLKAKSAVSKRIRNLKEVDLIDIYKAPDNSLYYTFTEKMMDLCFSRVKFSPAKKKPRMDTDESKTQNSNVKTQNYNLQLKTDNVGRGFSPANKESRPKGLPYKNPVKKDSNGFTSMAGNVWKVLSHIKEKQCAQNQNSKGKNQNER